MRERKMEIGKGLTLGVCILTTGLSVSQAHADPFRLLLESNADRASGSEVFYVTYDNYANVLSDNSAIGQFGDIDINESFSAGGLTYDGQYRLLLESNADASGGGEVYFVTYNSFTDVVSDNQASAQYGSLDINELYGAGGLAFDGTQYILMLERNDDASGGSEVFFLTYETFADVLADNETSAQFGALDINESYSAGGLTYDGIQYHLLLERNLDASAGAEAFYVSYNSFADLLSNTSASSSFGSIDINEGYSAGGFVAEFTPVPEPAPP
jgi:hypothetical protein